MVIIYSFHVLPSQFGTSVLFHIQREGCMALEWWLPSAEWLWVDSLKDNSVTRCLEARLRLKDGGIEGHVLIFSCENSKFTTHCWTTINKRMLDCTKKRYPTSKAKEVLVRWLEGQNRIENQTPYPPETIGGLKQNLVHIKRPHTNYTIPSFECLTSYGGMGLQWPATGTGTLGAADLGMA